MFCALSGEIPQEPVVSKKTGHIFEKALLEKYLSEHGNSCPVTDETLSLEDDILPLKVSKMVKPRAPSATSIPALLALFQAEWDSVMLESFEVKKQLESTRQELAHALYQNDAATRVIGRLMRELDEARKAIQDFQPAPQQTDGMDIDVVSEEGKQQKQSKGHVVENASSAASLSQDLIALVKETSKKLVSQRKKRQIPDTLASVEKISSISGVSHQREGLHSGRGAGIQAMDVFLKQVDGDDGLIASAGSDKAIIIGKLSVNKEEEDKDTVAVVNTIKSSHAKKLVCLAFNHAGNCLVSAAEDKTLKIWTEPSVSNECISVNEAVSKDLVQDISFHPSDRFFLAVGGKDCSLSFIDPSNGQILARIEDDAGLHGSFTAGKIHPDGVIMAVGTLDSHLIKVFDVKSLKAIAEFEGHKGGITSLAFSENGFYLISASQDKTIKLWDLRNLENVHSLELEDVPTSITFDHSGVYAAVSGSFGIKILHVKQWKLLSSVSDCDKPLVQVRFGPEAQYLVSAGLDNRIRFYQ